MQREPLLVETGCLVCLLTRFENSLCNAFTLPLVFDNIRLEAVTRNAAAVLFVTSVMMEQSESFSTMYTSAVF